MAEVNLERVSKIYADGTKAVDSLDLHVADGEFLVLVGPSGCGKTTALRMVAGLEDISDGDVRIGGRVVNQVPSRDRDIAMVFQSYALYPHLDVFANIAFGMRMRKMPGHEIDTRVQSAADMLGLTEHLHRRPGALSGGQRQRVAMGRAMVRNPSVFLMDEPLSNLDAKLRVQMRAQIARTTRQMGVTTIYVTHDQTEAMTLGHRVAVLKKGVLQQIAAPAELYDRPANLFVAGFIGSPAMNLVQAHLHNGLATDGLDLRLGEQVLHLPTEIVTARPGLARYVNQPIAVGIRPEDLSDAELTVADGAQTLSATVDLVEALGSDQLIHARLDAAAVVTDDTRELARDAGADDLIDTGARTGTELIARFSPRSRIHEGILARFVVDIDRMHFFDPVSGESIR